MPLKQTKTDTPDDEYWKNKVKTYNADRTLGLHFGFYEKGIHHHAEAVQNMNTFVERLLKLETKRQMERILDAGCGFGGTVLQLAKKYPSIMFYGINITPKEVAIAKRAARERNIQENTKFIIGDYHDTNFPPNYFDAIVAIESLTYTNEKKKFVIEASRILKPRGKLIIIDAFTTGVTLNPFMKKMYDIYNEDRKQEFFAENKWRRIHVYGKVDKIPDLDSTYNMNSYLTEHGFMDICITDISKNIKLSGTRIWILSILSYFEKRQKLTSTKIPKRTFYNFLVLNISRIVSNLKGSTTYCTITAIKK